MSAMSDLECALVLATAECFGCTVPQRALRDHRCHRWRAVDSGLLVPCAEMFLNSGSLVICDPGVQDEAPASTNRRGLVQA